MNAVELKWHLGATYIGADVVNEPRGRTLSAPALDDGPEHSVQVRGRRGKWTLATAAGPQVIDGRPIQVGPYTVHANVIELPQAPPMSLRQQALGLLPSFVTMLVALGLATFIGSLAPPAIAQIFDPPLRWVGLAPMASGQALPAEERDARVEVLARCLGVAAGTSIVISEGESPVSATCGALTTRRDEARPLADDDALTWAAVLVALRRDARERDWGQEY